MDSPKRAKLVSLQAVIEYSDGTRKTVDVDPEQNEALFWSDRSVMEMLAPFYKQPRSYSPELLGRISSEVGESVSAMTPDVVAKLWNASVDETAEGDRPILILKPTDCIATVPCKKWCK